MKKRIRKIAQKVLIKLVPQLNPILSGQIDFSILTPTSYNTKIGHFTKVYPPYKLNGCNVGDYTYIARGSQINHTSIGKFCSIGPDFKCGWGIHPTKGISTSPMFYSTQKQNGMTLCKKDKIKEAKQINIGNDVFIGRNVIVLDGVNIGNGAIIGAGAVVSKDIPPYAIAVGSPIQIKKFRFTDEQKSKLERIKWWDFSEEKLKDVEKFFFDVDAFIENADIK